MPFIKGQSGNPSGRPSRQRAELAELLDTTWSKASRTRVLKRLIADAETGDHDARTLLLAYAYGKPKEPHELSGGLTIQVIYGDVDPDASETP